MKFLRNEGRMKSESGANVGICQFYLNRCDMKAERLVHRGSKNMQGRTYLKKKKTHLHTRSRVPLR